MSLLESLGEALDALFQALEYDREQYIRERWWRFYRRLDQLCASRSIAVRPESVWPPFWGHRVSLGGDKR